MQRLLICGTNWLGDSIMSMPALQALKRVAPATHLTLLVKPAMLPLWEMHAAVDAAIPICRGRGGTRLTVAALRRQGYDRAVIFPNSLRSALLPFLVPVPQRIGVAGQWRRLLLTEAVAPRPDGDRSHQAGEYFALLGLDVPSAFEPPAMTPSDMAQADAAHVLGEDTGRPLLGILPGAARGGSKRWPPARFASVARALVASHGVRPVVFGTDAERAACDAVAAAVGPAARNLAGQTSLVVLAAALARCRLALTNDSGGMHLAAAVGTPVVAVFGVTDPALTGPLGAHDRILCGAPAGARSRDIPRESAAAAAALGRVTAEQVQAEAEAILGLS